MPAGALSAPGSGTLPVVGLMCLPQVGVPGSDARTGARRSSGRRQQEEVAVGAG